MIKREDLRNFIVEWNLKFPIDKWWREKHKVAFLSTFHKEANFLHQIMEYEEDVLFNELRNNLDEYVPNEGNFLKVRKAEELAKEELKNFTQNEYGQNA